MKKIHLLYMLFLLTTNLIKSQSLKSPDEFLGYPLGSKYTPHFKIVNYFNYVATVTGTQMKLEQYGETNEGRPLLLAYIASTSNFLKLEDIRKNNLRLTGILADKAGDINAPGLVRIEITEVTIWPGKVGDGRQRPAIAGVDAVGAAVDPIYSCHESHPARAVD